MIHTYRIRPSFACLALGALLVVLSPATVAAHTELERATPADGSTVPGPFEGPIRLEFSEELADGSKAELQDDGGGAIADAIVDGPAMTMQFELDVPLGPGDYEIEWTGVAVDGHVERGTVSFTVAPAPPTPEPTPSPAPTPVPSASVAPATPSPEPTPSASPEPSPTPPDTVGTSGAGDVLIPIVVALLVVAVGAAYLLSRRGRPAP